MIQRVERDDEEVVVGGYLPGQLGDFAALNASLEAAPPLLGEKLMGPLAEHLASKVPSSLAGGGGEDSARAVTLIPAGRLALLPLHAARYHTAGGERCFLDDFSVRYVVSAAALRKALDEVTTRGAGPSRLAGVGNPLPGLDTGAWALDRARALADRLAKHGADGASAQVAEALTALSRSTPAQAIQAGGLFREGLALLVATGNPTLLGEILALTELAERIPPSLDYAEAELRSVLDLLPADGAWAAFNEAATRSALWDALPEATILHLACHGQFDPLTPLNSALLLAGGTRLTLGEILDTDNAAALAACAWHFSRLARRPSPISAVCPTKRSACLPACCRRASQPW